MAEFRRVFPDEGVPADPADMIWRLATVETVPDEELRGLARRRLSSTRDLMQEAAGVGGTRIVGAEAPSMPASGKPRVDFRPGT
jgi:hypothetical protein